MKQTLMLIYPFPPVLPQFSFSPLQLSSNNYSYVEIFFLGGGDIFPLPPSYAAFGSFASSGKRTSVLLFLRS